MVLNELNVVLADEHLKRSSNVKPIEALKELIWNSCDADSTVIDITYEINELGNMIELKVVDNGIGIKYELLEDLFGRFGRSNKTNEYKSPAGRIYHGKLGQGRYKSFSIGKDVSWKSKYSDSENIHEFDIFFNHKDSVKVKYSTREKCNTENITGVVVKINNINNDNEVQKLQRNEKVVNELLYTFSPYLLAYENISIKYNGIELRPESIIEREINEEVIYKEAEIEAMAIIKLIKWKTENNSLYICGENGVVFHEEKLNNFVNASASVYIMSKYFEEMHKNNLINFGEADPVYNYFVCEAKDKYKKFCEENIINIAKEELINIKNTDIYPYRGVAKDIVEEKERQIFDIVSVELIKNIPKIKSANKKHKKLTYRLIQEAVKTNPDSLTKILGEVFDLSKEQQDDLAGLLDFTTLPNIINTSKVVSDRLMFLNALEQMIYDDIGKKIKERTQFQKIILQELWIFGDKYIYGVDDVSLKNVLKQYIKSLGREDLLSEIPNEAMSDLSRIPDICLWQQFKPSYEIIENLVIELKRPTKILGKEEADQIKDYAFKVAENKHFPKENTKWNFILIGKDYDNYVKMELEDQKSGPGNYYNSKDGNISISILRWNKLIQDNKLKYEFLRDKLNHQITNDGDSIEYLNKKYANLFKDRI